MQKFLVDMKYKKDKKGRMYTISALGKNPWDARDRLCEACPELEPYKEEVTWVGTPYRRKND